jgi:hypothetical protein
MTSTSDFSQAVKGLSRRGTLLVSLKAEYMSGVDAIIHVASPLPDTANPQGILVVRGGHVQFRSRSHILFNLQLFIGRCLGYHARVSSMRLSRPA